MQKRLVLLATGGTIASAQSDRGLAPALTAADILRRCPIDHCTGQRSEERRVGKECRL